MPKRLPARPNLEHLRSQAKALLTDLRAGKSEAVETLIQHLPEASAMTSLEVMQRGFRLADAQAAIARKNGFAQWPGLARHVERLRSLEGTWAFRSLELDGQTVPASMLTDSRLLIDGDRFRMESPEAGYEGIFTIDVEVTPHSIDIDFVEGPEAGNRCEGLFELDGDRFTICLGLVGSSRPIQFAAISGSGHALEVLKRVGHARPPEVDGGTPEPPAEACVVGKAEESEFETSAPCPTITRLQGDWIPLDLVTSGKPLAAAYLPYGVRSQTGIETKVVFGGQTMVHAKTRFNETSTPIEVDYLNLDGKGKGTLSLGIFRWEGDDAVFCMASPGKPRPAEFSSAPGSGLIFSRWRRKTPVL
jgi:uncharacterized protein (TIGR03067 family)